MSDYDEVVRWSDLGRPEQPVAMEVDYLGGYVHIEQEHIDAAAQFEGNPDVLL